MTLQELGFEYCVDSLTEEENNAGLTIARVSSVQRENYTVLAEYGENRAKLKGSNFYLQSQTATYPAVGDFVVVRHQEQGEDIIYRVLKRFSIFARKNPSIKSISVEMEQVGAVNFNYVFLIMSLNQDFNIRRLERYFATALESGGSPVVVLTKADLLDSEQEDSEGNTVADYLDQMRDCMPEIPAFAVSALTGEGMEALNQFLQPGKTIVLFGSSGIGKSSLMNAWLGEEYMKVSEIREADGRGRHTTTHRELICLPSGAMVIDTPGMRVLGLLGVEEEVQTIFGDIDEIIKQCRFADCKHGSEPGCAVRKAIQDGVITEERLVSFHKLRKEAERSKRMETVLKKKLSEKASKRDNKPRKKNFSSYDD